MNGSDAQTWVDAVVMALNVVQTCFLAYIASRSNRVRAGDRGTP